MSGLNFLSFIGIFALCGIAWLGSERRRQVPWKLIAWGIVLQFILGLLVFSVPVTRTILLGLSDGFNTILDATEAGARFVFGSVLVPDPANPPGPILAGRWIARAVMPPYIPVAGDRLSPDMISIGYVFAFRALPTLIFFSALMALLYSLNLIQPIVNAFARLFCWLMNLSGAEALCGAANIFVGIESMLVVRPFLQRMTRSELCAILAACFGSIASTVLALYAGLLRPVFPSITGHLVSASIMSIPACFIMAKILVPETEKPETLGKVPTLSTPYAQTDSPPNKAPASPSTPTETLDPVSSLIVGAMEGVKLAVAIAALLIAILGLVALLDLFFANLAALSNSQNGLLQQIGRVFQRVTLHNIQGFLFVPLTFLTGVSLNPAELWQASVLIGQRLLSTEIPAYQQLALLSSQGLINQRTLLIVSYVLCGFAHIPSYGIFVGGLVTLVPDRRQEITHIGWKALWAATLATLMVGCVAGVFDMGNPTVLGR
ncbi:nucleoside:proton symporter [Trichothermofontia sichuanensis B231]|uniref:NupC/NupG family nucleoside CNT transporter n=1 Tax=Trichothermofontia sichuanensis TaxID=3045816 RepID=UPI0022482D4D|nr:nucleoside transporter C-terminal domain-containing protein [Trichothermofontia sichuanensis]UZQ54600.1 nucleoside:proton symporter [Trichothermofontia sichuanensis B231]